MIQEQKLTKTVTHAQMNEGAEAFERYMQTGEMDFEEAFTAAVEASLGGYVHKWRVSTGEMGL